MKKNISKHFIKKIKKKTKYVLNNHGLQCRLHYAV